MIVSNKMEYFENYIVNLFSEYYGEKYRNKIISNFKKTYFHFNSLPCDDYEYVKKHKNDIDESTFITVKEEYLDYCEIERKIKKYAKNKLIEFIFDYFNIKSKKIIKNKERFSYLINLYCQNKINKKQYYELTNYFHFDINKINNEFINEFENKIKELNEIQKNYLLRKTKYGTKILNKINSCDFELLNYIAFDLICANLKNISDDYELHIKIPITRLLNLSDLSIDEIIIHELIHSFESSKNYVGITTIYNNKNKMANEIRTQLIAKKMTKKMHDDGIYIYDSLNKEYSGRYCNYEYLYPFYKIFEEYEIIFNYCAINNSPNYLNIIFGNNWEEFSFYLDKLYEEQIDRKTNPNGDFSLIKPKMDKLYEKMVDYFNNKGKYDMYDIFCKKNSKNMKTYIKK